MSNSSGSPPVPVTGENTQGVFEALRRGVGREKVNDGNVDALIVLAREHGEVQLEYLLREWRSDCGENIDSSGLAALPKFPPPEREDS